jgi:hypothetical protein
MSDEPPAPLPRHFKGKRPRFFDDPAADVLLKILLELAQEHWVTRARLQRLEAALARHGGPDAAAIEAAEPDPAAAAAERDRYIERLFAVLERDG